MNEGKVMKKKQAILSLLILCISAYSSEQIRKTLNHSPSLHQSPFQGAYSPRPNKKETAAIKAYNAQVTDLASHRGLEGAFHRLTIQEMKDQNK